MRILNHADPQLAQDIWHTDILVPLISRYDVKTMAEVGVHWGDSAMRIVDQCEFDHLYLIDRRDPRGVEQWTLYNHSERIVGKPITFLVIPSMEAVKQFEPESLDLVFIDSSHQYVHIRQDIDAWFPIVKRGGIIAGDDYGDARYAQSDSYGVYRAVNETDYLGDVHIEGYTRTPYKNFDHKLCHMWWTVKE